MSEAFKASLERVVRDGHVNMLRAAADALEAEASKTPAGSETRALGAEGRVASQAAGVDNEAPGVDNEAAGVEGQAAEGDEHNLERSAAMFRELFDVVLHQKKPAEAEEEPPTKKAKIDMQHGYLAEISEDP